MKTIELQQATGSLADYARQADGETVIITREGHPVAALVQIGDADWETLKLCCDPQFKGIIEQSRRRQTAEGGMDCREVRAKFGLPCPPEEAQNESDHDRKASDVP